MKPGVWRALALLLIAVAVAFVLYQTALPGREDFGIQPFFFQHPGTIVVTSVEPSSPAARAGIRPGDRLTSVNGRTPLERAQVAYATPGAQVAFMVNGTRRVVFTARSLPAPDVGLPLLLRLAFLSVAALLAWRKPQDRAARALVLFLCCFGLIIAMQNHPFPTLILSLILMQIVTPLLLLFGTLAGAQFAATFPSGTARPVPHALTVVVTIVTAVAAAIAFLAQLFPTPAQLASQLEFFVVCAVVVNGLLVLATFIAAYVYGDRSERQRRRWVFLMLGAGLAAAALDVGVQNTLGYSQVLDTVAVLLLGFTPFGLAYVILRHRVIDVGFILNRALVYAGVSAIIVAIFVVLETLLGKYVENANHVTSIAVQLAVALVLGFSIRFIHARVDHVVDTLLFRERHEAERSIREFAQEASYVTDAGVLITRCVQTVERFGHAQGAGVWLGDEAHLYHPSYSTFAPSPIVDENDPAVLAMRARRVIANPPSLSSALPGLLAFPMIVRGELLGMLVCGAKRDDEEYAPDERDALAFLASAVGHALDAIEIRELRRRLDALSLAQERPSAATGGGLGTF
jgi:hypothetical protein